MGVFQIVGFAVCWLVVAALMLWGVFTEHRRGPSRFERSGDLHPSRLGRGSSGFGRGSSGTGRGGAGSARGPASKAAPTDWVVVETCQGATPAVAEQAHLIASALLASRGIEMDALPPADIRTEITTDGEGVCTSRVLVRAGAMHASRRHH